MEGDDKFPTAAAAEENNLTGHPKKQIDAGLVADVFMNIVNFEDSLLVIKFWIWYIIFGLDTIQFAVPIKWYWGNIPCCKHVNIAYPL